MLSFAVIPKQTRLKFFMDSTTKAALLLNGIKAPVKAFRKLCGEYDPADLWHCESLWDELRLTERMKERLANFLAKGWAENEDEKIYSFGAKFISENNIDYPKKLSDLRDPPIGLYVKGNVNLSLPSVAIVGTRKCSAYAEGVAVNLGKALARAGITTISGGAKGIDTAGHRGTLNENGITVVVFGTGLDKTYPAENKDLFTQILDKNGAWITEYSFGTDGNTWRFPERDRLIAAIASHVVVAESPEDGGAMHTARKAVELGRDMWSIPGRIIDEVAKGTNMLMREGKIFVSIEDFISKITSGRVQVDIAFDDSVQDTSSQASDLTDDAKIIYSLIQGKSGITIDNLLSESGRDFIDVQTALNELEFYGLITNAGGRYSAGI